MAMFSEMEYNQLDTMKWNNFANFAKMFSDAKLLQALKVTIILTCAQFVSLAIALLMAAFLSQNVKGTRLFQTLYFVPYICSTVAVSIMWNNIFGMEGVINAILGTDINWLINLENPSTLTAAIFISIVWQAPGYGIVMYCSSFKAISPSLYEAAENWTARMRFKNFVILLCREFPRLRFSCCWREFWRDLQPLTRQKSWRRPTGTEMRD